MNSRHQMAQNVHTSRIDMGYVANMNPYDDPGFNRNERPRRQTNRMAGPHLERRDQFSDNHFENSLSDDRAERGRNSPPYNNIQVNHQVSETANQNLKNLEEKFTRILGDQVILQFDGNTWMAKFQGRLFSLQQMKQMCQIDQREQIVYQSNREQEVYREREDPYISYGSMPPQYQEHVQRQSPRYPQEQSSPNYQYAPMNYQAPYERIPYSRRESKPLSL